MPDPLFAEPRLAQIYDILDAGRGDLPVYAAIVNEFGAGTVLDVGCGTGTFASLLASSGVRVVGVDPAAASLEVARTKPYADEVTWILGDATQLPAELQVDLATMTGNVAQAIVADDDWSRTLQGIHGALGPGERLVFETRDPAKEDWRHWNRKESYRLLSIADVGVVEAWTDLLDVSDDLVSFRGTYLFHADGTRLTSDSTLRFRSRELVEQSLATAGFTVDEVRDAPDRPGLEFVFITHRQP